MLIMAVLTILVIPHFPPPKQKLIHFLFLMGLHVSISESDINNGFLLYLL